MSRKPANQGPRVNLTLTPEIDAVLTSLSKSLGVGKATFVRQVLDESLPQLKLMAEAAAKVTQQQIPDGLGLLAEALQQASGRAEQAQLDLKQTRRAAMRKRKPQRD